MSDPYIEDNGDEFPINNLVRCGQAAFDSEPPAKASVGKTRASALPRVTQTKFFPKAALPKRR
ncbi:hypothetical protein SAMN03159489_01970 [Pseudomonas sp. NFPP07]|jgi:hypothetical protein|uniref:Uncharacterized protein n=1 Tax=Pseudomonas chlororaphis TaxID=587753 RepID=A0AB34C7J0_9PSED|nr:MULTISPECIES: hypothetical protein [Pseudomonas]AMS13396.1 hypothetical protein A3218_03405 [Pseudomonas chlororaphis]AUG01224.1 hypothetical protein CXQ81_11595 [Pseudomonas sp. 09C 129]AZD01121.1 hypothetical protein C4K27_1917 [Pseudomonas chlororaphis subsp. chlororaphis]AZD07286.1 hypothetical protein C4K26_1873 [Pseudomonas chlororaphis]KAA5843353.1 hypothetical protein F2A38_08665 [Pseudomonas chlororaphis]